MKVNLVNLEKTHKKIKKKITITAKFILTTALPAINDAGIISSNMNKYNRNLSFR